MLVRLQKYIAAQGICSRRRAEELIFMGKIKVNGEVITKFGTKIDPDKDKVELIDVRTMSSKPTSKDSWSLKTKNYHYIVLNKPVGYITSTTNRQGQSVIDLLTPQNCVKKTMSKSADKLINTRLYPVGRLDKDSEGMVLLTNDGELTNTLTHPRYEHEKEYEVTIDKRLSGDAVSVLQSGMKIDSYFVGGIKIIGQLNRGKRTIVTVVLREGKNRQIRKMFGQLGYHVSSLKRTRINRLKLGVLPVGKWKFVKKTDII